jgi:hypothetical protein
VQPETQLSFTTLRDLVDEVFDEVASELPGPQRHAIAVTLLREAPEAAPPDPGAIGVAFLTALRALGARTPALIAVDDVQWADAASGAALRYAFRRLGPEQPLSVLLARRVDETDAVPLELDRLDSGRVQRLPVGPLSVGRSVASSTARSTRRIRDRSCAGSTTRPEAIRSSRSSSPAHSEGPVSISQPGRRCLCPTRCTSSSTSASSHSPPRRWTRFSSRLPSHGRRSSCSARRSGTIRARCSSRQ